MEVHEHVQHLQATNRSKADIERIYREWDEALSKNDPSTLLDLYADDAVLESNGRLPWTQRAQEIL